MKDTGKVAKKKKKKNALIICQDEKRFWTTQKQFWQWMRDGLLVKTADAPLTGTLQQKNVELFVVRSNTVLNLAHPNHLREAITARRQGLARK